MKLWQLKTYKKGIFLAPWNIGFATSSNESYVKLLINLYFKCYGRLYQLMYERLQYGCQPPGLFSPLYLDFNVLTSIKTVLLCLFYLQDFKEALYGKNEKTSHDHKTLIRNQQVIDSRNWNVEQL